MAAGNVAAPIRWIRKSKIMEVVEQNEEGEDIKTISCSSCCGEQKKTAAENDRMLIAEEGYVDVAQKKSIEIIYHNTKTNDCWDGKLRVMGDDRCAVVPSQPDDDTDYDRSTADQFIMYDLDISIERRDEVQPRVILIESQMKDSKHYFLHWSWPDPAVVCEHMQKYDDRNGGPQIDISDNTDQRFVWVIPTYTNGSNEFSLKPYGKPYYLAPKGASGTVVLCEGDAEDLEKYNNFKVRYI